MLTLWEMYNNPIEQLRKTSQDFKLLAKVLDYMEEAEDGSLSDVLMDKELDAAYTKIKCKKLVNNYIAPKSTLDKKYLPVLKDMFKKDKEEYSNTSPIPRSWCWRSISEGNVYSLYVENFIDNNGYNTFIVKDEFEFNLVISYFDTVFEPMLSIKQDMNINYPFLIDFNDRIVLNPMITKYPMGTQLPRLFEFQTLL